ncbi:MAG: class I SAM-dependent methyltransferase [Sedimentisphaerales bacterium]|nr:class I SAM-dependent methyltransferase [Sedimentisphaerales bacterium]
MLLMSAMKLPDNFYDKIKPRLYQRVGKELRLAFRVLDLGCGACELAQYLSETYAQKVTGVDISADSFSDKRNVAKKTKRIRCIGKDAARLNFIRNEAIDAVIISWALHEMENPHAVLQEAHRVLRPGGKILVVEFPRNSLAQKLWNENYYTSKELAGFLRKAGFKDIRAKQIEHKQILWVTGFRSKN